MNIKDRVLFQGQCKPNNQWSEGVIHSVFGDDLYNIRVTKSNDGVVWATAREEELLVMEK